MKKFIWIKFFFLIWFFFLRGNIKVIEVIDNNDWLKIVGYSISIIN